MSLASKWMLFYEVGGRVSSVLRRVGRGRGLEARGKWS